MPLCPFLGNQVIPVPKKGRLVTGGNPMDAVELRPTFFPCQGDICTFWNNETQTCVIKDGFEALPRLEARLGPLGKLMGGR